MPFYDSAKIVLHLIPIVSFNPAQACDIAKIASSPQTIPPIYSSGWNHRYNLDGFLTYSQSHEQKAASYVQLFRNGIIEAVEGRLLQPHQETLSIPRVAYERELIKSLGIYLATIRILGIEPPIFIFLTCLGVKGYTMSIRRESFFLDEICTIDRDILLLPETVIESYDTQASDALKPCFDSVWNACGLPRSLNYDDKGKWNVR